MLQLSFLDVFLTFFFCTVMAYVLWDRWLQKRRARRKIVAWPITFRFHHQTIKGTIMQVELMAGYELPYVLGKPINAAGEVVEIDGPLNKVSTDEAVFTDERDDESDTPDDPYVGKLVYQGEGTAIFQISGDADMGSGIETIELDIDVKGLPEGAVGFAPIQFGTPRKKKPAESPAAGE